MRHLQFAIASIVDANTGNGFSSRATTVDTTALERRAHEIRSRSVLEMLAAVRDSIATLVTSLRERNRERRELAALSGLSDYYLEDIGLTRGDVTAVELGQSTLACLNAERRVRLSAGAREINGLDTALTSTDGASNEDNYVEAKSA